MTSRRAPPWPPRRRGLRGDRSRSFPFTAMMLASLRGNQAEAAALIETTLAEAAAAGQGIAVA